MDYDYYYYYYYYFSCSMVRSMGCPSSRTRKHLYVYERALREELILKYSIISLTMNTSEQTEKTRFMPDHSEVEEKSKEWLKGVIRPHDESRSGPAPPWYIEKIVDEPCKVMACSMGTACFMIFLLVLFLATGVIEFELDTSPDSFNVKFDDMADRFDANRAVEKKTKPTGPSGFQFREAEEEAEAALYTNESYYLVENDAFLFLYEVKNGKDHVPDGGAGGNIFDPENLKEILEFENAILSMPQYTETFCNRNENLRSNHCSGFSLSPRILGYSTTQSLYPSFESCCMCDGNISLGKNGPCAPKTLASICMYNETAYPFAVIPYMDGDGHQIGGTFTSNSLKGILGAFSETLSCSAKNIPPLASMLSFFSKKHFHLRILAPRAHEVSSL